jgi:hypothetical protein
MAHALETLQQEAMKLEKKIKEKYGKYQARQLIAGSEEAVDYSYQREKNMEWYVKYIRELESRL